MSSSEGGHTAAGQRLPLPVCGERGSGGPDVSQLEPTHVVAAAN
jgi:hypothetical protein